ncbi:DUF1841 family protein [Castellaniella sp.]|uniref:DUF1841 family protein n=1 Tax=Castellaniella sp. TaxID=1955812 RepID=UPI00355FC890
MFNPSKEQVRSFFTEAWQKRRTGAILTPLETMAADLVEQHPEYHTDLQDPDAATRDYPVEAGRTNPFLHLSMHLAIREQVSIDQPPGIRAAWTLLRTRKGAHEAEHIIMEALGEVVWEAQRMGTPFDNAHYLELIRRHATREH